MISENIRFIRSRIEYIAKGRGRQPGSIKVVAVSKTVDVASISEALENGISDIGESRIQEASTKITALGRGPVWHMIGHLQTNKAKKAVELFDMIQSLDSLKLAETLNRHATELNKIQECLIEVKVSQEESKFGVSPEKTEDLIKAASGFKNLAVKGLMTIAPYIEDKERLRPYFRIVKELFDSLSGKNLGGNVSLEYLSMGMSSDYDIALEEGSNMVRIGGAIFGERVKL